MAAVLLWIEQGPTIRRRRGSFPSITLFAVERDFSINETLVSDRGSSRWSLSGEIRGVVVWFVLIDLDILFLESMLFFF